MPCSPRRRSSWPIWLWPAAFSSYGQYPLVASATSCELAVLLHQWADFLALPSCPGWIRACPERPWHHPGRCRKHQGHVDHTLLPALGSKLPRGWQLVLFSHLESLSELGPDPAPNLRLPGLALDLVRAFFSFLSKQY